MKTRILTIIAALTFSAALAFAADTPVANDNNASDGNTNNAAPKAACCQGASCGMATGGTCSCKKKGDTCAAPASDAVAAKAKTTKGKPAPKAASACCASDGCGKTSGGSCNCKKKGQACAPADKANAKADDTAKAEEGNGG